MTRRTTIWIVIAGIVLVLEFGATLGSAMGEPFAPVEGWGRTRSADSLTFVTVIFGCVVLALFNRYPRFVAAAATASYLTFSLLDHELGMFLPPMVSIFGLVAYGGHRLAAVLCATASLASGLVWVASRVVAITEPGVVLLAWVAFGSVLAAFFFVPLLLGEIVRARTLLRQARPTTKSTSR